MAASISLLVARLSRKWWPRASFWNGLVCTETFTGRQRNRSLNETGAGADIILEVDVQGAASVRQLLMDSVSIFILPPSYEVLQATVNCKGHRLAGGA